MATLLWRRDVSNQIADAKATLSSWDGCMSKAYCKWPVIAAIIVGGLILLSILICFFRCLCCGAECACCCFRCCASCCPSPSRGRHKRVDSYPPPQPHSAGFPAAPVDTQYRSAAPPQYGYAADRETPQFATFDTPSKPVNEDALPPMPSWGDATSRKVEEVVMPDSKEGDMEMNSLNHQGQNHNDAAALPMLQNTARAPTRSPVSPLNRQGSNGYPSSPHQHQDVYASNMTAIQTYNDGRQETGVYHDGAVRHHSPRPYQDTRPDYHQQNSYDSSYHSAPMHYEGQGAGGYGSNSDYYQSQHHVPWQDRQAGRKPVNGSWRDV